MARNLLKPSRRWFQLSLRGYLIFVAVLCLCLNPHAERAMRQWRLLGKMQRLVAMPHFNCTWSGHHFCISGERNPSGSVLLGDELLRTVRLASFSRISTSELELLVQELRDVEGLTLGFCCFTKDGWQLLRHLPNLQSLNLSFSRLGDAELGYLSNLVELRELNLDGTNVGDDGLRHLKKFRKLESLRICDALVTERGSRELLRILPADCEVLWQPRFDDARPWFDDPAEVAGIEGQCRLASFRGGVF